MFIKRLECVALWTTNYKKLGKWYQEVLELPVDLEQEIEKDTGMGFMINGVLLWIGERDDIEEKSQDPKRVILEFWVDSVDEVHRKLLERGVTIVAAPFLAPNKEFHVVTAEDLEGNFIQFLSKEP